MINWDDLRKRFLPTTTECQHRSSDVSRYSHGQNSCSTCGDISRARFIAMFGPRMPGDSELLERHREKVRGYLR